MADIVNNRSIQGASPYVLQGLEGANQEQQQKLAAFFKKKQAEADVANDINKQKGLNQANLETLQNPAFQEQLHHGGSAKAGDLSVGADPYAHMSSNLDKGEEAARQKAIQNYNHALPKIQQVFQAANEGIDFVNDPKNPGSLGQARTLALKSMGMNRYNEKEAEAVVPPTLRGHISALFNQGGSDLNPLNDVQRGALNQFFHNQVNQTQQQHELLKKGSLDTYSMSRYARPEGQQALQNVMGGSFDKAIDEAKQKYSQVPATQGPNLTPAPNPGPLDKLKSFFGGGQQQPASNSAQNPPKPSQVIQNGHTYNLNPQTGQYE